MCLGIPGMIERIEGEGFERRARVSFGGLRKQVSLAYVPEAGEGDYVIVHVGFAISVIDESEARRTFDYLREIGELQDEAGDALPG